MGGRLRTSALAALIALLAWAGLCAAGETPPAGEARGCLACHAKRGVVKKFEDGAVLEAYVDAAGFGASVHKRLTCSDCHGEFAGGKHPDRMFRSVKQYKIRSSLVCRRCHGDKELGRKQIHSDLLRREEAPVCTDCHGTHAIMPVAGGGIFASEEHYCLSCHGYGMEILFKSGERLSIDVDEGALKGSAHKILICSDCHFGFSSEEHPLRSFRSRRDYTLASSEVCRRCHFDKYSKTLESIHFKTLSQGNLKAPVCVDCHGAHEVPTAHMDRTMSALKCKGCHGGIYDVYARSVHGNALVNEYNRDVPACVDCHKAHDITNPLEPAYHELIPEMCSNCHKDGAVVGKYGLSTDVVKTYLSDFHGVTLELYRREDDGAPFKPLRPIAVCTDCHGTHDIASTVGADPSEVKTRLLQRCRKCHPDATENFPDAWLSHYVPNLSKAPLVYIINTAYKIFLPVMVIGLLLQILLHAWRYIVDR